jgi:predicted DNA-binding protein (MmcQ/YjbR family)
VTRYSFKTTPEKFAILTATDGIVPAPYAARFHWVAITRPDALQDGVARQLIGESYELVASGLPTKLQKQLGLLIPDGAKFVR